MVRTFPWKRLAAFLAGLALAVGCCSLASPVALAAGVTGGNSFSELTQGNGSETSTTATTSTAPSSSSANQSSSNSKTTILLAALAAVVVLCVIGAVIVRDARRVAPVPEGELASATGPSRDAMLRLQKRRAKAKAARRQRKRNR